jgi:hypothetical protein
LGAALDAHSLLTARVDCGEWIFYRPLFGWRVVISWHSSSMFRHEFGQFDFLFNSTGQNEETTMPLYEIAIIQQPTKKETEDGIGAEKLLYGPTSILARDEQTALMTAMIGENAPKGLDLNRVSVLIRPFADA